MSGWWGNRRAIFILLPVLIMAGLTAFYYDQVKYFVLRDMLGWEEQVVGKRPELPAPGGSGNEASPVKKPEPTADPHWLPDPLKNNGPRPKRDPGRDLLWIQDKIIGETLQFFRWESIRLTDAARTRLMKSLPFSETQDEEPPPDP